MTRITWDAYVDRIYEQGVSQGVFYPENSPGVAWNGLISVTEAGEQAQEPKYFDGQKYHDRNRPPVFAGTISAYTYPDEFEPYDGISSTIFTGQPRKSFGFSYKTKNEIHIVYNVLTAPSNHSYSSIDEKPNPLAFEWSFTTLPENIPGGKPSSHIVIMIDAAKPAAITDLEAAIYGDDENEPRLPSVEEIIDIFESAATLRITDNGDGTYTALGPDNVVILLDDETFQINWSSVVIIDDMTFSVSSL